MATIDQCLEGATFPLDQIRHPSVGNNRNNQTLFLEIAITTTIPPVTMPNQDLVDSLLPLAVIVTVYLEITILKKMGHLASQWVPPKTHHLGR